MKQINVNAAEGEVKEVPIQAGDAPQGVPSVYTNAVSFVGTPFDLRFIFGQIQPRMGKLVNEPLISVVMSWEHGKALANFLQKSIEEHERDFGPLHHEKRSDGDA